MDQPVPPLEPAKSIIGRDWRGARARLRRLPRSARPLFADLLEAVETAWPHVRALQLLHDQLRPGATGTLAHVLDFIDDHVCDLFRSVAVGVAAFVPGAPDRRLADSPDFDTTDGDADQFGLFVGVLRAACFDPAVPGTAAEAVRAATEPLLTWYEAVEPLLRRAADTVQEVAE